MIPVPRRCSGYFYFTASRSLLQPPDTIHFPQPAVAHASPIGFLLRRRAESPGYIAMFSVLQRLLRDRRRLCIWQLLQCARYMLLWRFAPLPSRFHTVLPRLRDHFSPVARTTSHTRSSFSGMLTVFLRLLRIARLLSPDSACSDLS